MTVIAIGEVVVDWLSTAAGKTFQTADSFFRGSGGNASNVAIGLARLGTPSRLLGKVGDDIHGQYLQDILQAEGVDLSCLCVDGTYPTAQCYALTDGSGNHIYYNWPPLQAASRLQPDEITAACLQDGTVLHSTGISFCSDPRRLAVLKAMDLADQQNMVISFDANFATDRGGQAIEAVEAAFKRAHILKFNHHELLFWRDYARRHSQCQTAADTSPDVIELERAAQELFQKYQPLLLAVTMSESGSMLLLKGATVHCPPFKIDFESGIGAGDGFMAGMIHALHEPTDRPVNAKSVADLTAADWKRVGMYANAVGALATTSQRACDGLPGPEAVQALLSANEICLSS